MAKSSRAGAARAAGCDSGPLLDLWGRRGRLHRLLAKWDWRVRSPYLKWGRLSLFLTWGRRALSF
ncbi:MAG: hypothetical protein JNJ88_07570 [Planctomycetes bacterium]|nr:hypothetical protein [Planctomycetota bacterium]